MERLAIQQFQQFARLRMLRAKQPARHWLIRAWAAGLALLAGAPAFGNPFLALEDAPSTGNASPSLAAEGIEEALEEAASPLNSAALSIEHGEHESAKALLVSHLRTLEATRHRYHLDMVRPLALLGDAQLGQGDFQQALNSYERALHVHRVNEGLLAPSQAELVYKQAEALHRMGDIEEAGNREEYAYEVLARAHEPLSETLLPATYRLADWHRRNYDIFAARALYKRAMHIHESNDQQGALAIIPALQGLVVTYRLERFPPRYFAKREARPFSSASARTSERLSVFDQPIAINNFPEAERALQRIVRIRREHPQSTPAEVGEAILDLADWHLLWERFRKAHALYEHVYAQFDALDSVDAALYFAQPLLLHFPVPNEPRSARGDGQESGRKAALLTGFVETAFRVSPNGSVQNIQVIASQPEGLMDFRVRRSLRGARYRPAMIAGKAAPFENNAHRHEFQYLPKKGAAKGEKQDADADAEQE